MKRLTPGQAREAVVYEKVLSSCDLPAPRFRCSLQEHGWTWLLIEYIQGHAPASEHEVRQLAASLVALHHSQRASELLARELRTPTAPTRYGIVCQRSLKSLAELEASPYVGAATRALTRLVRKYSDWPEEAAWMANTGQVAVHGNLHPGNVIISASTNEGLSRPWLLDWPDMSLGTPLEDLGTMAAELPEFASSLCDSYIRSGGTSFDLAALRRAAAFQLFAEVGWRARRAAVTRDAGEIETFEKRASLFGA